MSDQQRVSVVIPAKNEAASVGNVVAGIKSLLNDVEVIVVDDGSTDATARLAEENGARVVAHSHSRGNGAAIKSGAKAASGDVLVFMDADGQHDPKDIIALIDKLNEGYDMVVGARSMESQASIARGFANTLYNWLASYMVGQRIEDLTSGFRAVNADKFRKFLFLLPDGFSYPTTITMAFFKAGYEVVYHPIKVSKRIGKSHVKILKDGMRFFLIIFKVGTLYSPFKLFLPIAILQFLVGVLYYAYTFTFYHTFTNMSALMITSSILIFLIGLVSEQITTLTYMLQKDDDEES